MTKLFSDFEISHFNYDPDTGLITNTKTGKIYSENHSEGYIQISVRNKHTGKATMVHAHRLAWYIYYGTEPSVIDHKNGIRDDNSINNLQSTSNKGNSQNRKTSSTYPGVSRNGPNYKARVRLDDKRVYLGTYTTKYEAHLVATYYKAKYFINYRGNDLSKVPLPVGTIKHPYFSNTLLTEILKLRTVTGIDAISYFV